jgi:hypothetical protein
VILRRKSGDYNREGCSDILWRNNSGDVAAEMNRNGRSATAFLRSLD